MKRLIITSALVALIAGSAPGQARRVQVARNHTFAPVRIGRPVHRPFVGPITAQKIRTAVDDAVMYLRSLQQDDGSIEFGGGRVGGATGLAALAMLAAGADPAADDQLKAALDWLAKLEPNDTYVRGIRANVWEYALRKVPYDTRMRELLEADYRWLLAALGDREGWRYNMQSRDWDNSCTQYGVLGVWAAARAGFEVPDKFWQTMSKHFRTCQNADGGWGYVQNSGSTPNMATAGLASMFLVFDMYHGRDCYTSDRPRAFADGEPAAVLESIERGMNWLGKASGNKNDGYYLYGIERTGVAGGRKLIGGQDWFADGALAVLNAQRSDGSIPLGHWGGGAVSTSFCTLFLVYGGAPVAIDKLQYGTTPDWNLNPRDLANLSKYLWSAYERPLNWQTVSIDSEPEQFEAPLLLISGSKEARFTEEEMLKLRRYIYRGGTIVAEPSDGAESFTASMRRLARQMFPQHDFPNRRLEPLPADHDVYRVIKQPWRRVPRLEGISDGSRLVFVLSNEYLSGDWQTNRTESDAFRLATNLLFYATDLSSLSGKFATLLPDTPPAEKRDRTVTVARVRHASESSDWDAAAECWTSMADYCRHVTGCELIEHRPVVLGTDALDGVQLLHVTGRAGLEFPSEQRGALDEFVRQGGTLLVDAYAGSPAFAASARRELEAVFGELEPLPDDSLLAEGRFDGGADLADSVRLKLAARQLLRKRGESTRGQKLLVAHVDGRPAVIFSTFDLCSAMAGIENYRSLGYNPKSAAKIVGNVLALLTLE